MTRWTFGLLVVLNTSHSTAMATGSLQEGREWRHSVWGHPLRCTLWRSSIFLSWFTTVGGRRWSGCYTSDTLHTLTGQWLSWGCMAGTRSLVTACCQLIVNVTAMFTLTHTTLTHPVSHQMYCTVLVYIGDLSVHMQWPPSPSLTTLSTSLDVANVFQLSCVDIGSFISVLTTSYTQTHTHHDQFPLQDSPSKSTGSSPVHTRMAAWVGSRVVTLTTCEQDMYWPHEDVPSALSWN